MLILSLLTFFFFNDTATTEIYTLSLHDALPICCPLSNAAAMSSCRSSNGSQSRWNFSHAWRLEARSQPLRSEEHTSELQSRLHLVCSLLLEKKNSIWPSLGSASASATLTSRSSP